MDGILNLSANFSYESGRNLITAVENKYGTTTVSKYEYTNNALGNRTVRAQSGSAFSASDTINYTYNNRSEITGATAQINTAYNYAYGFDPIGNRLTANLAGTSYGYTANSLNQYTLVNAIVPTYDVDGNMLTNGSWTYTWNGENRLTTATDGTKTLTFAYDYAGRRISKQVSEGTTPIKHIRFVYDKYKLIEELDALNNNALLHQYTWQPESVGLDVPLTLKIGADTYYYHTDANKNIIALTDSTGNVVNTYRYSPFGQVVASTGTLENPFQFSSEYYDEETGLVYYNYRYYNPQLGRWLSRDPIEERGGINLYNNFNDMVSVFDRLGLSNYLDPMSPDNPHSILNPYGWEKYKEELERLRLERERENERFKEANCVLQKLLDLTIPFMAEQGYKTRELIQDDMNFFVRASYYYLLGYSSRNSWITSDSISSSKKGFTSGPFRLLLATIFCSRLIYLIQ